MQFVERLQYMFDLDRLQRAYDVARGDLIAECSPAGHWVGHLSSSPLATATAISALSLVERHSHQLDGGLSDAEHEEFSGLICGGLRWLAASQNPDGGWGDTDRSPSNIAATMLVRAAFRLTAVPAGFDNLLERAEAYVESQGGVPALRRRYGHERSFAAPVLANCALAGLVGWRDVAPLPFELACLPSRWYQAVRLPLAQFAIPVLVAVGQVRFHYRKPLNPLARLVRGLSIRKSLEVLAEMQPASGGFLEAPPLTSFVVMSLAGMGLAAHPIVRRGVEFLKSTVRPDGSWSIEANMATRNTTSAVKALGAAGENVSQLDCLDWLLDCQHDDESGAARGGWAWTDGDGAVPETDDTAGAMLALSAWRATSDGTAAPDVTAAARDGVAWLLARQNRDGGWPTFTRGWGTRPFDRSGADLTAHSIRALRAWSIAKGPASGDATPVFPRVAADPAANRIQSADEIARETVESAINRGFSYLESTQSDDGAWLPLWYGSQQRADEQNPIVGTARVLAAYRDFDRYDAPSAQRAVAWLLAEQNPDGGWGGRVPNVTGRRRETTSSVEETALAVEALIAARQHPQAAAALEGGLNWLAAAVESGRHHKPAPLGLYFARLWYYERLAPLCCAVSTLGQALRKLPRPEPRTAEPQPIAT